MSLTELPHQRPPDPRRSSRLTLIAGPLWYGDIWRGFASRHRAPATPGLPGSAAFSILASALEPVAGASLSNGTWNPGLALGGYALAAPAAWLEALCRRPVREQAAPGACEAALSLREGKGATLGSADPGLLHYPRRVGLIHQ